MLLASTVPNCVAYDPCYAYELAVIVQDGLRRMYGEGESIFYYLAVMNENYAHPAMPAGAEAGILKGGYRLREGKDIKAGGRINFVTHITGSQNPFAPISCSVGIPSIRPIAGVTARITPFRIGAPSAGSGLRLRWLSRSM